MKHIGSKWSWHHNNIKPGRIIGRLDRVLCNHHWIDSLAHSFYEYHDFATSDHAPMVLHFIGTANSDPKPFRYVNFWAQCDGYKQVINNAWSTGFNGSSQFQVVHKLKEVKKALKEWRKTDSISTKARITSGREKMKVVHDLLGTDTGNIQWQKQEKELKFELQRWLAHEEDQVRQKTIENWLAKLGDRNSNFFHSASKTGQHRNHIKHLLISDGELIQDTDTIKAIAPEFYQ